MFMNMRFFEVIWIVDDDYFLLILRPHPPSFLVLDRPISYLNLRIHRKLTNGSRQSSLLDTGIWSVSRWS